MKKSLIIFLIAAIFIFTGAGAYTWDGLAVVAPEGELPAEGRYVATDSFPSAAIVDITNLETGKSTRAIVTARLDNPELLAMVSQEAANLIDMTAGSVTRLRMVTPLEPIARTRFTENESAGIHEYDSGNVITEESYREGNYRQPSPPAGEAETIPFDKTPPSYTLEEEWRTRDVIVDLPYPVYIVEYVPVEREAEPVDIAEPPANEPEETAEVFEEEEAEEIAETAEKEAEEAEEIAEALEEEEAEEAEEMAEAAEEKKEENEKFELVLVPAEERPPESLYGIDPEAIIPGISIPSNDFPEPAVEHPRPPIVDTTTFSVPRIFELERNRYYVQIAAFNSPQPVENALKLIDSSYQPRVYKDGDEWYRILLGPLNQGESAAILQRFKSIGYTDAFVRYVR